MEKVNQYKYFSLFNKDISIENRKTINLKKSRGQTKCKFSKSWSRSRYFCMMVLLSVIVTVHPTHSSTQKISIDANPSSLKSQDSEITNAKHSVSHSLTSSPSEYVLREIDSQIAHLPHCKKKLIESYVKPNFQVIDNLKMLKWFPTNRSLYNLKEIVDIISSDLKHEDLDEIIHKKREKELGEGELTIEEIMGQQQSQDAVNELRVSNRNTEDYLEYAVPSTKEIRDVCPSLQSTCCTEPQFLSLFVEFNEKKKQILMKVRILEKIIQILDEIRPETLEKMQAIIDFYRKEFGKDSFDPQDYFKDSVSFDVNNESILKIIVSLRSQAVEQFTEYKRIIQRVLKYYSGFACGICDTRNHGFFYLVSKKDEEEPVTIESGTEELHRNYLHSMVTFDVDVCANFGESLSARISFMVFLAKLSVVGQFFEFVKKIRLDMDASSQTQSMLGRSRAKSQSKMVGISMNSPYSQTNSLAYWVGLKQVSLFCSEKENFMLEKCINLCRKFFNITHTNFLYDENLLIVNIFNDLYEVLYLRVGSDFGNESEGGRGDLELGYYDSRRVDQVIRPVVSSEDSDNQQLLGYELEKCKIKPLYEEVQKMRTSGELTE